jgi:apolipoprotein N-acyltransferase
VYRAPIHRQGAAAVAVLLVLLAAGGMWRVRTGSLTTTGTMARIGLVQGSVEQVDKYDTRFRDAILRRYLDLSRRVIGEGASLVIWPEASTPFYFDANSVLSAPVRRLAVESHTPFIVGSDELARAAGGLPDRYYNSAVLVGTDGQSHGTYRKIHLVPFGEYVPLKSLLFFVGPLVQAVSDFSPGSQAVVLDANGQEVSVAICYESVYPDLARTFVAGGSQLLATITNDAWFDRSSAASQHFEQGALRAVEEGRYFVRAANTGISGAVDPYGRILAETALFVPMAITVDVRLIHYRTIYNRLGDLTAWLALAAALAIVLPGARRWRRA